MNPKQKKLPDSVKYIPLVVEALRVFNGYAKAAAVKDWIADTLDARGTPVKDKLLKGGESKFATDIRFARMYLVDAGMIEPMETAGYGNWKLTRSGWGAELDADFGERIVSISTHKHKPQGTKESAESGSSAESSQSLLPGMESWELALKETLASMPPKGFERLCTKIMTINGLIATKTTGQSGDGGIDGEGMLPVDNFELVKMPVAWQCKRFKDKSSVSSKDVRDFRGAIEGRARYGLIFTTASLTVHAEQESRRPGAIPIELVGLERLVELMGKKCLGIKDQELEPTFFEEFLHPPGTDEEPSLFSAN